MVEQQARDLWVGILTIAILCSCRETNVLALYNPLVGQVLTLCSVDPQPLQWRGARAKAEVVTSLLPLWATATATIASCDNSIASLIIRLSL